MELGGASPEPLWDGSARGGQSDAADHWTSGAAALAPHSVGLVPGSRSRQTRGRKLPVAVEEVRQDYADKGYYTLDKNDKRILAKGPLPRSAEYKKYREILEEFALRYPEYKDLLPEDLRRSFRPWYEKSFDLFFKMFLER